MQNHDYTELIQCNFKILSPYFMKWNTLDDFEPILYFPCSGLFGTGVTSVSILLKLFSFLISVSLCIHGILRTC